MMEKKVAKYVLLFLFFLSLASFVVSDTYQLAICGGGGNCDWASPDRSCTLFGSTSCSLNVGTATAPVYDNAEGDVTAQFRHYGLLDCGVVLCNGWTYAPQNPRLLYNVNYDVDYYDCTSQYGASAWYGGYGAYVGSNDACCADDSTADDFTGYTGDLINDQTAFYRTCVDATSASQLASHGNGYTALANPLTAQTLFCAYGDIACAVTGCTDGASVTLIGNGNTNGCDTTTATSCTCYYGDITCANDNNPSSSTNGASTLIYGNGVSADATDVCIYGDSSCGDGTFSNGLSYDCDLNDDVTIGDNTLIESESNALTCTGSCSGSDCCSIQTEVCNAINSCQWSGSVFVARDEVPNAQCHFDGVDGWEWDTSADLTETCNDGAVGYDNDCDGLIDCADTVDCGAGSIGSQGVCDGLGNTCSSGFVDANNDGIYNDIQCGCTAPVNGYRCDSDADGAWDGICAQSGAGAWSCDTNTVFFDGTNYRTDRVPASTDGYQCELGAVGSDGFTREGLGASDGSCDLVPELECANGPGNTCDAACDSVSGNQCDLTLTNAISFSQEGTCTLDGCDTTGNVCFDGSDYRNDCSLCANGQWCDSSASTGGNFVNDGLCIASNCCTLAVVSGEYTGASYNGNEACGCVDASTNGQICDANNDGTWDGVCAYDSATTSWMCDTDAVFFDDSNRYRTTCDTSAGGTVGNKCDADVDLLGFIHEGFAVSSPACTCDTAGVVGYDADNNPSPNVYRDQCTTDVTGNFIDKADACSTQISAVQGAGDQFVQTGMCWANGDSTSYCTWSGLAAWNPSTNTYASTCQAGGFFCDTTLNGDFSANGYCVNESGSVSCCNAGIASGEVANPSYTDFDEVCGCSNVALTGGMLCDANFAISNPLNPPVVGDDIGRCVNAVCINGVTLVASGEYTSVDADWNSGNEQQGCIGAHGQAADSTANDQTTALTTDAWCINNVACTGSVVASGETSGAFDFTNGDETCGCIAGVTEGEFCDATANTRTTALDAEGRCVANQCVVATEIASGEYYNGSYFDGNEVATCAGNYGMTCDANPLNFTSPLQDEGYCVNDNVGCCELPVITSGEFFTGSFYDGNEGCGCSAQTIGQVCFDSQGAYVNPAQGTGSCISNSTGQYLCCSLEVASGEDMYVDGVPVLGDLDESCGCTVDTQGEFCDSTPYNGLNWDGTCFTNSTNTSHNYCNTDILCYIKDSLVSDDTIAKTTDISQFGCKITDSYVNSSEIYDTLIVNSTVLNSYADSSTIKHAHIENMTIEGATIIRDTLIQGKIVYNNLTYFGPFSLIDIYNGVLPYDQSDIAVSPYYVSYNTTVTLTYTTSEIGLSLTVDGSPLGQGTLTLLDDGVSPDLVRNDGTYTARTTNLRNRDGTFTLIGTVDDGFGNIYSVNGTYVSDNFDPYATLDLNSGINITNQRVITVNLTYTDTPNLISNYGFEENYLWSGTTRSTAGSYEGSYAAELTSVIPVIMTSEYSSGVVLDDTSIQYRFGACVHSLGPSPSLVQFLSWSGASKDDGTSDLLTTTTIGSWDCLEGVSTTVVPSDVYVDMRLYKLGIVGTVYYDNVFITPNIIDTTSVDSCRLYSLSTVEQSWNDCSTSSIFELSSGDGIKTVYADVRDAAGNMYTAQSQITLDTTPPTINVTSLTFLSQTTTDIEAFVAGSTTVTFIESELHPSTADFYYRIDDDDFVLITGYNFTFDSTQYSDGSHILEITHVDLANNVGVLRTTLNVDNTPEDVIMITPDDLIIVKDNVTSQVYAPDRTEYVEFTLLDSTGTPVSTLTDTNSTDGWEVTFDTSALATGRYTLSAQAISPFLVFFSYVVGEDSRIVLIDHQNPTGSLSIIPSDIYGLGEINNEITLTRKVTLSSTYADNYLVDMCRVSNAPFSSEQSITFNASNVIANSDLVIVSNALELNQTTLATLQTTAQTYSSTGFVAVLDATIPSQSSTTTQFEDSSDNVTFTFDRQTEYLTSITLNKNIQLTSATLDYTLDAHPDSVLSCYFEGSTQCNDGIVPQSYSGVTFPQSTVGQGVLVNDQDTLIYSSNYTNPSQGTLLFDVTPTWLGNDSQNHVLLMTQPIAGEQYIMISKNASNVLAFTLVDDLGVSRTLSTDASHWNTTQTRHVAISWSNSLRTSSLYVDGVQVATSTVLTPITALSNLMIGHDNTTTLNRAFSLFDTLLIYNRTLTALEISDHATQHSNTHLDVGQRSRIIYTSSGSMNTTVQSTDLYTDGTTTTSILDLVSYELNRCTDSICTINLYISSTYPSTITLENLNIAYTESSIGMDHFISNDGGVTFTPITLNTQTYLNTTGSSYVWRAVITAPNNTTTPSIRSLTLTSLYSPWQQCQPTYEWELSREVGYKTVYMQIKDKAGNIITVNDSIEYNPDSVELDTTRPLAPQVVDKGQYTNNREGLIFDLEGAYDRESELLGVELEYRYRVLGINTSDPLSVQQVIVPWTQTSSTHVVASFVTYEHFNYTIEARSVNPSNLESDSAFSDGIIADFTAPQLIFNSSTHLDGVFSSESSLLLNWTVNETYAHAGVSFVFSESPTSLIDNFFEGIRGNYSELSAVNISGLSSARYYFRIKAQDEAGNWGPVQTYNVFVDRVLGAPAITLLSPRGTVVKTNPQLYVTTNEETTCTYRFESSLFDSQFTYTTQLTHISLLSLQDSSSYTLNVTCSDKFSNTRSVSSTFNVNTSLGADSIEYILDAAHSNAGIDKAEYYAKETIRALVNVSYLSEGLSGITQFSVRAQGLIETKDLEHDVRDLGYGLYELEIVAPTTQDTYALTISTQGVDTPTTASFGIKSYRLNVRYTSPGMSSYGQENRIAYGQEGNIFVGLGSDSQSVNLNTGAGSVEASALTVDENVYLFVVQSPSRLSETDALLEDNAFSDSTRPSFGLTSGLDQNTVVSIIEYDNIIISGHDQLPSGKYLLVIRNDGIDPVTGKTNVTVKII